MSTQRTSHVLTSAVPLILLCVSLASADEIDTGRCASAGAQLESPGACREAGRELAQMMQRFAGFGFSGAVLVADRDGILLHDAYGLADAETGATNTVQTRFPLLSVTKPLVATALLQFVDEGQLDLDLPLSTYLGEFPDEKSAATAHHLLTHTAGLIEEGFSTRSPDRDEFVANVKKAPIDSPPGEKWRYSNAGSSVAAALLEIVADTAWEETLSTRVFDVAGMQGAVVLRGEFPPDTASGHRGQGPERAVMNFTDAPPYVSELWWGAAGATGVVATVADVYRWIFSLATGRLLAPASRQRMMTAHVEDQGYGWHIDEVDGHRRSWKGGGAPMYEYQVAWYPDDGYVIVIAMNDHAGWRVPIWSAIERNLLAGEKVALPEVSAVTPTLEKRLAGHYRTAAGEELRFRLDSDFFIYEPLDLAEESQLPRDPLLMRRTVDGDLAGLELRSRQMETPITRLALIDGAPILTLPSGRSLELTLVAESSE